MIASKRQQDFFYALCFKRESPAFNNAPYLSAVTSRHISLLVILALNSINKRNFCGPRSASPQSSQGRLKTKNKNKINLPDGRIMSAEPSSIVRSMSFHRYYIPNYRLPSLYVFSWKYSGDLFRRCHQLGWVGQFSLSPLMLLITGVFPRYLGRPETNSFGNSISFSARQTADIQVGYARVGMTSTCQPRDGEISVSMFLIG